MLRLPSRQASPRVYLSEEWIVPQKGEGHSAASYSAATAALGLQDWWMSQGTIAERRLRVELSGGLCSVFCLPFSPLMSSPSEIIGIASAYAGAALGSHAPCVFRVAGPVVYGLPVVVAALYGAAGNWDGCSFADSVQVYALASLGPCLAELPASSCWLVVAEPAAFTYFYCRDRRVMDAFSERHDVSGVSAVERMERSIARQFHRESLGVFCYDEFDVLMSEPRQDLTYLATSGELATPFLKGDE